MIDAIDVRTVTVENGDADVLALPPSSTIRAFTVTPGTMHLEFDGQGSWPAANFEGAAQEATLWLFLSVGGHWVGTGAERLRPNQRDKPEAADPRLFAASLLDAPRWPTMGAHTFAEGETFGVMVTPGNTRLAKDITTDARTNIALARYANGVIGLVTAAPLPALTKGIVLAAAVGLDPEKPTALAAVVARLAGQGYAISVMDHGGQPSDHKVWCNGEAWTFISSDNYQPGTFRWDPYLQGAYDGKGYNACGIPVSQNQPCPAWATGSTPPPVVTPPAPPVEEPVDLQPVLDKLAELASRLDTIEARLAALEAKTVTFPTYSAPLFGFGTIVLKPSTIVLKPSK